MHNRITCKHKDLPRLEFNISFVEKLSNGHVFAYYGNNSLTRRDMNIFLSNFVRNSEKRKRVKIKVC
jgi:hypothetical protein